VHWPTRSDSAELAMEQERGISVTSSVMQFPYKDRIVNLLDTPGHEDFSEDTYRTLTAVDSALMVIDVAKGVEARTEKLMEVCRLRTTPALPGRLEWESGLKVFITYIETRCISTHQPTVVVCKKGKWLKV